MTIKGSCFCGSISYKVEGKLRDARSCHCSECRKAFSAQASAYALINDNYYFPSTTIRIPEFYHEC